MPTLHVFDPAMCCSTGICGPNVDPVLPRFAADLEWLKSQGVTVERYNLSQQPGVYAQNMTVRSALEKDGTRCLPLLLMGGRIVSRGQYPDRRDLAGLLGIQNA